MFSGLLRAETTVVLIACVIAAALGGMAEAFGLLGSIFPWLLLTATPEWSDVLGVLPFHTCVWIIAMTGGDRWATFGLACVVLAVHALDLSRLRLPSKDGWLPLSLQRDS